MSEMSDLHDEAEEVEGEADEWIEPDSDEYVNLAEGNIEWGEIDDAMYNYQQAAAKAEVAEKEMVAERASSSTRTGTSVTARSARARITRLGSAGTTP